MDQSPHQSSLHSRFPKPQQTPQPRPTALITGASSGIGYELAKQFAQHGYDLVLVARRERALRQLAEELQAGQGARSTVLSCDLSQPTAAEELVRALAQAGITVDVLVNNAGFTVSGAFVETDWRVERNMLHVNILALTVLTKLILPGMVKRGRGRILNVASTAAFQPGPLMAVYYATKAYVLSFSEAIGQEVRGTGVTVTALCPGSTATGFQSAGRMEDVRLVQRRLMSAERVAREGYHALMRGQSVYVPGWLDRLGSILVRFVPRGILLPAVRWVQDRA